MISKDTIEELMTLCADARMSAANFTEALAAQSEKHEISKSALRRYVVARVKEDVQKLDQEAFDLAKLLDRGEQ